MHRALFVVLLLGCSSPTTPATPVADSGPAADSTNDVFLDVESIPLDTGSCGHDLCHNFDDGRISPLGSTTVTNGGGVLALDTVARSTPNSLRASTTATLSGLSVARIEPQVEGGGADARMKFSMRLDPITFATTDAGFMYLAGMHLDDVRRDIALLLNKDGFVVEARYAVATDGGSSSVELPAKTFATKPLFDAWIDVELTVTPAGDGARVVVRVGSESVAIDMPASITDPMRSARFDLGVTAVPPCPPATVRFDDLTLDTGS